MNEAAKSNANVADYNFSEEKYIDEFYQSANRNSWMALHAALKFKENSINPFLIKAGKRRSPAYWPASLMAEKGGFTGASLRMFEYDHACQNIGRFRQTALMRMANHHLGKNQRRLT